MRVLFLILLAGLLGGAWWLARRADGPGQLSIVVIHDEPSGVRVGDPVLLGQRTIGRVEQVQKQQGGERVHVVVDAAHQGDVRTDSVWRVQRSPGAAALVVDNRIAVGPSLEDGAEVRGGVDPTREWIARGKGWFDSVSREAESLWKKADGQTIERQFDEWTSRVPEWRERGSGAFAAARNEIATRAREAERKLRESGRVQEADQLRERLDRWLDENPPAATDAAPGGGR